MEDYRKADAVRWTHDDYRRTATVAGRPPPTQTLNATTIYKWVLILLLQTFNALGFITLNPIMPFVQMQFFNENPPNGPCKTPEQTASEGCKAALLRWSQVTMWWGVSYGGLAFIFSPVVGRLSDAFGRLPLLRFSMFIIIQQNIFLYLSGKAGVSLWYYWIFNSFPDFVFAIASSYVADMLPVRWRGFAFGLNAASGAVCSIVGAWVVDMFDNEMCFLVALVFRGSALLIAFFVLPESLAPENREEFDWSVFNSIRQLSILGRSSIFMRLATVIFLGSVIGGVPQSLYLRGVLFFTAAENANLQIISGVAGLFVQVAMIKPMLDHIGERATTVIGLSINVLFMVGYSWIIPQEHSHTSVMLVYIFGAVSSIANVNYPAISAIKSMLTGPEEQGQVLGALAGVQSIGFGVGPLFFNVLFSYLLAHSEEEGILPSGSDHGQPAQPEPSWARHLGITLSPAWCFRVAVLPAAICVLLACSIPDPREILKLHGVGKAGALVSKQESEDVLEKKQYTQMMAQRNVQRSLAALRGRQQQASEGSLALLRGEL